MAEIHHRDRRDDSPRCVAGARQHQRAARRDLLGRDLLPALSGRRGYPAQSGASLGDLSLGDLSLGDLSRRFISRRFISRRFLSAILSRRLRAQGCLLPITFTIPAGSLLSPSAEAGVVGGNVLTSQRVTDVILRAFRACAASQGCMNNLTFGNASFGYYETIAGGAGAGDGWHGRSGVQTHMTNTRITDPEILERRYPVILRRFGLRAGSGGRGAWRGGDGVVRELQFRVPLTVSILSERRATCPYGMDGGGPGERGANILRRLDGQRLHLGGKATVGVAPGEVIEIHSPGGGGCGEAGGEYGERDGGGDKRDGGDAKRARVEVTRSGGSLDRYREMQESA